VPSERVVVLLSADPEVSHRANEAIRIALGIIAGENAVTIVLVGPGVKVFDPTVEDYVDGEDILKHLMTLKRLGQPFHAQREAIPADGRFNPEGIDVVPVDPDQLAQLLAESDRVLIF
jgi:sulfur relay (sulfurtransferase) DsrF/TusC family protein